MSMGATSTSAAQLVTGLEEIETSLAELAARIVTLEKTVARLTLPAAQPMTVKRFAATYPSYTEGSLRWLLFHRQENGLDAAVIRRGRRLLIDVPKFFEWEATHREAAAPAPRTRRGGWR
jgi:hypothetical protein